MRLTRPFRAAASALSMFLALPACAKTPAAQQANAATDADPALWVVRDKDTTIYLFGTIHVLKPGLSWFDEAVKAAFDRSGELVLETVLPDPAAMAGLVRAAGTAKPGTPPLTERIPADKRAAFTAAVTAAGLPGNAFDGFQPWLAATQLSIGPVSKQGYETDNAPESVLTQAAKAAGKPVRGLETPEQQLGYFSSLSDQAQLEMLTSSLDELPKVDTTIGKMVDDWAHGRPDALAAEMNDSLKDSPEVARVLLVDRNKRWAQWIGQRMQQPGTIFIAVGSGHLAGPDSVQAQLARQGIKAKRVKY
ncbi:TraB/GumN family protein [Sphingomonas sp. KR1UV-12]|uniref:TraB/GumN family protein n=1 Tax=Sphingomonas aurea TaxID=3063994 RepID=A0ABT9EG09_9SPHN|nr:TraB/GumN family protein [Sphingomonas sp. KR1UV-12]MDP1025711.1 TraB/GumN family protein [Sphingomonas sp. KR1UV-12]